MAQLAEAATADDPALARSIYLRLAEQALLVSDADPTLRIEACRDFERAQAIEPEPSLALRLGRLYESDERWDAALEHLLPLAKEELAAELGLDHVEHLLHCASLLRRSGQLERAANFTDRAIPAVDPQRADALAEELFPLWIEAGRNDKALELAHERAPGTPRPTPSARSGSSAPLHWLRRATASDSCAAPGSAPPKTSLSPTSLRSSFDALRTSWRWPSFSTNASPAPRKAMPTSA